MTSVIHHFNPTWYPDCWACPHEAHEGRDFDPFVRICRNNYNNEWDHAESLRCDEERKAEKAELAARRKAEEDAVLDRAHAAAKVAATAARNARMDQIIGWICSSAPSSHSFSRSSSITTSTTTSSSSSSSTNLSSSSSSSSAGNPTTLVDADANSPSIRALSASTQHACSTLNIIKSDLAEVALLIEIDLGAFDSGTPSADPLPPSTTSARALADISTKSDLISTSVVHDHTSQPIPTVQISATKTVRDSSGARFSFTSGTGGSIGTPASLSVIAGGAPSAGEALGVLRGTLIPHEDDGYTGMVRGSSAVAVGVVAAGTLSPHISALNNVHTGSSSLFPLHGGALGLTLGSPEVSEDATLRGVRSGGAVEIGKGGKRKREEAEVKDVVVDRWMSILVKVADCGPTLTNNHNDLVKCANVMKEVLRCSNHISFAQLLGLFTAVESISMKTDVVSKDRHGVVSLAKQLVDEWRQLHPKVKGMRLVAGVTGSREKENGVPKSKGLEK